jgi:hypothetical protein
MTSRKWEYKLISTNDVPGGGFWGVKEREALEAHLNQLGTEGWEIVSMDFADTMQNPSYFQALARRER